MIDITENLRKKENVDLLLHKINSLINRPVTIMEVCGTHTMSIFRYGIRSLLPETVKLVSGPGCPVCVTSQEDIDKMIGLAHMKDTIIATFGDLIRVPGSNGNLSDARSESGQVKIVYSPADALALAQKHPGKQIVFLGIGFETTAPTVAATILHASKLEIDNFSVYSSHKLMPPALNALFSGKDLNIDGLLCPGHVSTIIGAKAYEQICNRFKIPCVIAGFEPVDILKAIYLLIRQITNGEAKVENAYERAVSYIGNNKALSLMEEVFLKTEANWRGLGKIKKSGLKIKEKYSLFDAEKRFNIQILSSKSPKGCICGDIIKAKAAPTKCPLFAKKCTPMTPVGPCMVSSEGTCSAYYRYGNYVK